MNIKMPQLLTAKAAARVLSQELGKTLIYWQRYLRANNLRAWRDRPIPFEESNGQKHYSERCLYHYIYSLRPSLIKKNYLRKTGGFWCRASLQPSYRRAGALGVTLSMPSPRPTEAWLSRGQMIHLAHELLIHARYIVGRSMDCTSNTIVADPSKVLMSDDRFEFLRLLYASSSPLDFDPEVEALLDSLVTLSEMKAPAGAGA